MNLLRGYGWVVIKGLGAAVLLTALAGCGGSGDAKPAGNALQDAPAEVASLYKANCVSCHGTDLQGKIGEKTNLQKVGERMTAAEIITQIEQGSGVMQGFSDKLTEAEISSLANWLAGKK
ncbi:c-type cytochrome [Paenibacillus soyae]|uniref:Cytochrome c n=1 Tax=Paenibacillus soyae TaxID=2969249 RepID=A0A9X2MUK7_9BACL|nr:cytochrome c [Paenibacillus soyae]MCR2806116.1 cytochrome c [Paenibacillus soyae]